MKSHISQKKGAIIAYIFSCFVSLSSNTIAQITDPDFIYKISENAEKMKEGKFKPTWESLQQYQVPEWFRNAKFGMWTHWGPQCQPQRGD